MKSETYVNKCWEGEVILYMLYHMYSVLYVLPPTPTMGNHIAGISWKYSYAKSVASFAGTMKSFAGMVFWANIKRKIEASYQPVNLLSISLIALAGP